MPGVATTVFLAGMLESSALPEGPPAAALMAAGLIQVGITIVIGAFTAPAVRLGAPAVTAFIRKQDWAAVLKRQLKPGVLAGAAAGLSIMIIDALIFAPRLPAALTEDQGLPLYADILSRLLYGGIVEEILMRWGLMSLIVWFLHFIISRVKAASSGVSEPAGGAPLPGPGVIWAGILLSSLVFGLGHLPVTAALVGTLTPVIVTRALLLNGLGGIAFGWLYARFGLESAMIAHGAAHLAMLLVSVFI